MAPSSFLRGLGVSAAALLTVTSAGPAQAAVPPVPRTAAVSFAESVVTDVVPPPAGSGLARPATGDVTSGFGMRVHPVHGDRRMHEGVDFAIGDGAVHAAADGVVTSTGSSGGYGLLTEIEHTASDGTTFTTRYAHQASMSVTAGEQVTRGQAIGRIGSTGTSTGPHLHFEVIVDGVPVDGLPRLI